MSIGEVSHESIYDNILVALNQYGASEIAIAIRSAVARGVVVDPNEESSNKTVRAMNEKEKLAVALEFLVSTLEVPLMIQRTRDTFKSEEILWMPEATTVGFEPIAGTQLVRWEADE